MHLFAARAERSYLEARYAPGDALVFGKESVGLDPALLARFADRAAGIPTLGAVRSLNLANAVGIALYEALRQMGSLNETFIEQAGDATAGSHPPTHSFERDCSASLRSCDVPDNVVSPGSPSGA